MDELIEARRAALHDVIDDAGRPSKVSAKHGSTPPHMSLLSPPDCHGLHASRAGKTRATGRSSICRWPGELPRWSRRRPSSHAAGIAIPELHSAEQKHPGEKYR